MRKILLLAVIIVVVTYTYVSINEAQKEKILLRRVPKIEKVNKYEFSRALYQIREVRRSIKMRENTPPVVIPEVPEEKDNDLEKLRNAPSNPATPIDEQNPYQNPNNAYQNNAMQQNQEYNGNQEQNNLPQRPPRTFRFPMRRSVTEYQGQQQQEQPQDLTPYQQQQLLLQQQPVQEEIQQQ